jgi:hypothetical protein
MALRVRRLGLRRRGLLVCVLEHWRQRRARRLWPHGHQARLKQAVPGGAVGAINRFI